MAIVRGCEFPTDLIYSIENNVWVKKDGEIITIGMTTYSCCIAGEIESFTPKKMGKNVQQNKSCATVESGKWVGPVKSPAAGEVVEVNEKLQQQPAMINQDPYGQGWLVRVRAEDWARDSADLLSGEDAIEAFETKMEAEGFLGC